MTAWKTLRIVGVLLLLVGMVMLVDDSNAGPLCIFGGLLLYVIGRVAVWLKSKRP